ncbi:MAG: cation diffusion facilitator family transporter [Bacteroidetes bacterium]|nr:cation diffusion facilitator family transporter [Bacteroidota bacterium]
MENKSHQRLHELKVKLVVYLTGATMIVEIIFGYFTNSMALLADGFHMSSHFLALGISWIAYYFARKQTENSQFRSGTGKILSLSGYTNSIILLIIAILIAVESIKRFVHPLEIKFSEAIFVAVIGLFVNLISAFVLYHKEEHSDQNLKSAYLHVIADALTSVTAIIALTLGMYWKIYSLDAISCILSAIIISKWAIGLAKNSGEELLDYSKK